LGDERTLGAAHQWIAVDPRTLPRLRLRLLLVGLPLAGGAGLVLHILAGVSLPLGIAGLTVLAATIWLVVLVRLRPVPRRLVYRRVGVGAVAGLVGSVAYDLARYGVVALFSMSFQPFHVFAVFGELFVGPVHPAATLFLVGLLYHLCNGTFFGVAYTLVVHRPMWWSGALWGIYKSPTSPRRMTRPSWSDTCVVRCAGRRTSSATRAVRCPGFDGGYDSCCGGR